MESSSNDLKESKLAYFIGLIPKHELLRFNEFLNSPYFGISKAEIELFTILKKAIDHNRKCNADQVSTLFFPNERQEQKRIARLRKLSSNVLSHILHFFELQYSERARPNLPNQLASLQQYGATEQFDHYYDRAMQKLEHAALHSFKPLQLFMIDLQKSVYQASISRSDELPLQQALDHLEQFYIMQRLRLLAALKNQTSILGLNSTIMTEHELLRTAALADAFPSPLIQLYIKILSLGPSQSEQHNEQNFMALKATLTAHGNLIEKTEAEELYSHAINHCIMQINKGNHKYLAEYFMLYQQAEQYGIISKQGQASIAHFKNMVAAAIKMGRSSWAEKIMQDHGLSDPLLNGILKFHLKHFKPALSDLFRAEIQGKDVFYRLSHRVYTVMAFYETDDVDAFEAYGKALQMFLRRSTAIPETHRKSHLHFLKFIFTIYHFRHSRVNGKSNRLQEIETELRRCDIVAQKAWLMEKIKGLKKECRPGSQLPACKQLEP